MTSAHELMKTVYCAVGGCPDEAEKGSDLCRDHRLRRMFDDDRAAAAEAVAAAARALGTPALSAPPDPQPDEEKPLQPVRCKAIGCVNDALPTPPTSKYRGLCADHRRRSTFARKLSAAKEPVVPDAVAAIAAKAARLAHLTLEIEQTRDRLLDLQGEALRLLDELREQVAA